MPFLQVLFWVFAALAGLFILICYLCYRKAFLATKRQKTVKEEYPIPEGEIYEPYRPVMEGWLKAIRKMPQEKMQIISHDGLTLRGTFYEYAPGAPIELMFHGYRGCGERDLSGGVRRCFLLGRSALIVDQRASATSDGHVITFGIRESRDCLQWIEAVIDRFGPDCKIILCGISMGASTVLTAAGNPLPHNVIGVLADCGFSSPRAIMEKVIADMGLPPRLCWPFVRMGAILFGGFDPNESSAMQAMEKVQVPVILFHGEDDAYVPCEMSRQLYEVCQAPKKALVTIPKAGHGLAFAVDPKGYLQALRDFFGEEASFDGGRDIMKEND